MQEGTIQCHFGKYLNEDCYLNTNSTDKVLHKLKDLETDVVKILILRTPSIDKVLKILENGTVCDHHHAKIFRYYSNNQRKCCDPWNKHKTVVKTNLKEIHLDFAEKSKSACKLDLIPGRKVCKNCWTNLNKEIEDYKMKTMCCIDPHKRHREKVFNNLHILETKYIIYYNEVHNIRLNIEDKICSTCIIMLETEYSKHKKENSSDEISETATECIESTPNTIYESDSQKIKSFDETLRHFHIPPFKRQKLCTDRLVTKGVEVLQNIVSQVTNSFEDVHSIKLPNLDFNQMSNESIWFQKIISNIKSKFDTSNTFEEKVSLLTLLPDDWNLKDIIPYFKCTYHMLSESKKLKRRSGALGIRKRKSYTRVSQQIRDEIVNYYLDSSNTIMCSGMKECVTIKCLGKQPVTLQKQILIYDIKDLYENWISDSGHEKVPCLAFFTQMRPKQCVIAGDSGTHNVCICSIHQNVKLKLAAVGTTIHYTDVIEASVCSVESRSCMLQRCDQCPNKEGIRQFLESHLDIEYLTDVKYSNWGSAPTSGKSSVNRVTLKDFNEPITMFIDNLSRNIWDMIPHHFISTKQKEYFSYCKQNLENDTGILIMDFAENYSFLCQNSTQGFYFSNSQATLFTAALYYKETMTNELKIATFCVISNSTIHQAYSVNVFMENVLNQVKKELPWIKKLLEFSDGAPTQFKNKNHLSNVCFHEEMFGFKLISYNFFATSHGKNVCDGIGATAKRTARKASKQGIRILTVEQMYNYLAKCGSNIRYSFVEEEIIIARAKNQEKRFKSAKTVKNTRLYHSFTPINQNTIRVKEFSSDSEYHDSQILQ